MTFDPKSLILITLQILLILVPFTWTPSMSELFEFPKMLITYAGAIVISSLWMARMIQERRLILRRTPFEFPILMFIASQTIATLLSLNPHTSLYGYYSRFNGGLLSFLAYASIYFAVVSNLDLDNAKRLLKTLVFSALFSALYAFPEHFGHSPSCAAITGEFNASCWVQDVQTRVFGTFGQPNWLAAYLITLIFIPLSRLVHKSSETKVTTFQSLLPAGVFLLLFLVLLFTKSRSGILGFGVGFGIFSALSFLTSENKKALVSRASSLVVLLFISFLIFGKGVSGTTDRWLQRLTPATPSTSPAVATPAPAAPANSLEVNITPSSDIRRIVWKGAWELATRYPFFGTGVETFAYSYYNVRPVEHNLVSEWDFLYNKAHNEFLNFAATTGFGGLTTYLIFLATFVIWTIRRLVRYPQSSTTPTMIALVSGFVALAISNFFGFSTVPVNTLLFLFPAIAYLLTIPDQPDRPNRPNRLLFLPLLASCFLLLSRVHALYLADTHYAIGKTSREARNYPVAIEKLQEAIKLHPTEPLYTDELSLSASEVAVSLNKSGKTTEASAAAKIALELSNRTIEANPVHLNFYKTRTKVFLNLSEIDPAYGVHAGITLDQAIKLAPTDAKLWYNRAILTYQLGFKEESLAIFDKTIALKPNYEAARFQYAQILEEMGQPENALAQYTYILERINPENPRVITAAAIAATASASTK